MRNTILVTNTPIRKVEALSWDVPVGIRRIIRSEPALGESDDVAVRTSEKKKRQSEG